jgi:3-hydroxybutyryl-CoA dehydratase
MNEYRWTDLTLGMSARFEAAITDEAMQRFAALSGDVNPLHVDEAFAQRSGFPGRVAYGLLTSSFYSTLVGMYLPGRWALLHGLDIELKSPAFIGDVLTISGEITHLSDAFKRMDIKASVVNERGRTISKATIRAAVHER